MSIILGKIMIDNKTTDFSINYSLYKNHSSSVDGIRDRMIERHKLTIQYIEGKCNDKDIKKRLKDMSVLQS